MAVAMVQRLEFLLKLGITRTIKVLFVADPKFEIHSFRFRAECFIHNGPKH